MPTVDWVTWRAEFPTTDRKRDVLTSKLTWKWRISSKHLRCLILTNAKPAQSKQNQIMFEQPWSASPSPGKPLLRAILILSRNFFQWHFEASPATVSRSKVCANFSLYLLIESFLPDEPTYDQVKIADRSWLNSHIIPRETNNLPHSHSPNTLQSSPHSLSSFSLFFLPFEFVSRDRVRLICCFHSLLNFSLSSDLSSERNWTISIFIVLPLTSTLSDLPPASSLPLFSPPRLSQFLSKTVGSVSLISLPHDLDTKLIFFIDSPGEKLNQSDEH